MRTTAKLPIPLHRSILRVAAQPALKGIQAQCLSVICFECEDIVELLNPDARSLVGVFCDLLLDGFSESDIIRLDTDRTFEDYANFFLDNLSDDALLILSLVTWHFDASLHNLSTTLLPPRSLLRHFIESRNDSALCEALWSRYTETSGRDASLEAFTTKFRRLIGLIKGGFLRFLVSP
ncbi:hypothetical protein BJX96DRAFT_169462 [Aspergillus floccosus]